VRERFNEKWELDAETGCWLWTAGRRNGYGSFYDGHRSLNAHRVAWELYRGPIPEGLHALHRCGVKLCVRPFDDHLYLGDDADNFRDQLRLGERRSPVGEEKARLILAARGTASQRAIARRFGTTHRTVKQIWSGETWPHLQNVGGEDG